MNKKNDLCLASQHSKSNKMILSNPNYENLEENEKTKTKSKIKKKKSKSKSKTKTKKRYQSSKGIMRMPILSKLEIKEKDKKEIEFVLGDFNDFHSLDEIKTFENMISLTLVNESIKSISSIVDNLPNPSIIKFLNLNQNEIENLDDIDKLINLEALHLNFNYIEKIPSFFFSLKKLHTFWISENNISVLENLPISIKNLWIANNDIEHIPENFEEMVNLEMLNISGNFINDLKDLYILGKIKKLKRIYLNDINFGENPICLFENYRKIMIHIFSSVEIIDQIKVTTKEKNEVEKYFNDNMIINNDKIKQNYKLSKMVFRLMKTYKFFFSTFELYKIKTLSLKLKKLEYNIYEKNLVENDLYNNDNNNNNNSIMEQIKLVKNDICNNLSKYENLRKIFYKLKTKISILNDLFIAFNFYKLETCNNIEIEPGNLDKKWSIKCLNMMKEQFPEEFLKKYNYKGVAFNQIYKIRNNQTKFIFNSVYEDLIDEFDKFGEDKKYYKYFYLIMPEEIAQDERKMYHYLLENKNEEENIFFCDNYSYIDEFRIKQSIRENNKIHINNEFTNSYKTIVCKCVCFENSIEVIDARFNFFFTIEEIKNYLINLKSNSTKDIICLKIRNNINFYYCTSKGLFLPKYIIHYKYESNDDEYNITDSYLKSFEHKPNFNEENEKLFNVCAQNLFSLKNRISSFVNKETLNKYSLSKFFEYKELDNNFLFFIRNSLIAYLNICFKYNNKEKYFNEIKLLNERIDEINNKKFNEKNFLKIYDDWLTKNDNENDINLNKGKKIKKDDEIEKNTEENNKTDVTTTTIKNNFFNNINFINLKCINLFNQNLNDKDMDNFLMKLKKGLIRHNEILQMVEACEELVLSSNNITSFDLSEITKLFQNLKKIDLSHNNISYISYTNINTNKLLCENTTHSLKTIDISYNNISDFNIIIKLLKGFDLSEFIFFGNPFDKKFEKLIKYNYKINLDEESKELILKKYEELILNNKKESLNIEGDIKIKKTTKTFDYIYTCYSFSNEIRSFNDCIYFRDKLKYDNDTQINIAYLNNKNLKKIPMIEDRNNIKIIYLNSNKINKIENLKTCYNLKELFLQNNKIKVIENLPNTLIKLDLSNNFISNLTGIESAFRLVWINLENNNIKVISLINKLCNITELYCANNLINNFDDCCKLGKLKNLEILDISGNEVVNNTKNFRITMVHYCPNLKFLNRNVVNGKEKNISLEFFTGKLTSEILEKRIGENNCSNNLVELNLSSLNLKDDGELFSKEKYPKLKKLNLSKNNFTSFSIFGSIPTLLELNLSNNSFVEIFPKKGKKNKNFNLQNLIYLDMSSNQLINLNGIQYFSKLKKLKIQQNSISKIDTLDKMNQLNYLNISFNKLRSCDKTNIGILPALKIFICDNNYLKNITCFEKYYSLEILSFNNNKITDMGCLENLSRLENLASLSLINNPITKIVNYRKIIIYVFQNLRILDNIEIYSEERVINDNEKKNTSYIENYKKEDDSFGLTLNNFNNNANTISNNNISNSNINNSNLISFKKLKQRVNYIQIGSNLNNPFKNNKNNNNNNSNNFISSQRDSKKLKNNMPININGNLIKTQKNNEINASIFLSKQNKINSDLFPSIRKSYTMGKGKRDMSKVKYSLNSKINSGSVILLKGKKEQIFHRPRSTTRIIPNNQLRQNSSIFHNQDYFAIVLNSVNNNDIYDPLITLKNWNIRKINFK